MAKRRTLVQALAETHALRGARTQSTARLTIAQAEARAPSAASHSLYEAALGRYADRVARAVDRRIQDGQTAVERQLALAALELDLHELASRAAVAARAQARRTMTHARREVSRVLDATLPWGPRDAREIADFTARNVFLLRRVGRDQVQKLRELGLEADEAERKKALWVARNRSSLIARDQTAKFMGEQVRYWSLATGSEGYVYLTCQDERVRESHRPHHGKRFSWHEPPSTGHPGTQPSCRCRAMPISVL